MPTTTSQNQIKESSSASKVSHKDEDDPKTSTTLAWMFIICLIFTKMMLATARRNLSPFVPYLASTLQVDVQIIAVAIASQRFVQIICLPLLPLLWDMFKGKGGSLVKGKARVMIFAVVFLIACLLIIAFGHNLYLILIVIGVSGAAKAWFDPSALSMLRNVLKNASPRLRGVAAAGLEFNWGLASLVGVPVSGLLLSISFTLPFLVLAITTATMLIPLSFVLYQTIQQEDNETENRKDCIKEDTEKNNRDTDQTIQQQDNETANRKDCIKEDMEKNNIDTDPTKNRSTCCTKLCLVACSVPTVSNMLDACCSALFMSNKDMSFGLWLNQTHGYDQLNIARVSTIFGGADLLGELILVLLLARGINALKISQIHTFLLMASGVLFMVVGPSSDVGGLVAYFLISMFNEIKAVCTLTLGALNNEKGLDGLAETSTYAGQAVGFTVGVLLAPAIWDYNREIGVGIWFLSIGGICIVNHIALWVWQRKQAAQRLDCIVGDGTEGKSVEIEVVA